MEQAKTLLDAAIGDSLEALWVLALTSGMRRGEVLALKWQDIDFEQNMLQVKRIFTLHASLETDTRKQNQKQRKAKEV